MFGPKLFVTLLFLSAALMTACSMIGDQITLEGSGEIVTREQSISDFDKMHVSHSFRVKLNQGDTYRVVVRVDDNILDYLLVEQDGDTLRIGLDSDNNYDIRKATMEADVTMPELIELRLSGSSDAEITGFASNKTFDAHLSGSSSLRGDIVSGDASFGLSGSSSVNLSGSGSNAEIHASGGSDIDLSDYAVADVSAHASGSSEVNLNMSGRLDVSASGASRIYYLGNPTLGDIGTSGNSLVEAN